MDYSKIKLENERNSHVTKRLNRLNTWQFFKVIYRENIWRMFGFNFLMVVCILPIFIVMMLGSLHTTEIEQTLPILNSMGFSTGAWVNLDEYMANQIQYSNIMYGLLTVASSLLITLMLSGGFAVIRDAFWTGKLSTVGVFKSIGKGIKANILYAFVTTLVTALSVFGIYCMFISLSERILWLAIVLTVLLSIILLFVVTYLLILCSVSVTYKQSVLQNMDDSWRLLWLNVLPNIIHVIIALIPIVLYLVFSGGLLQQLLLIVMLMFGGLYFPLVWQTHMMKTFALFHPVEVKKKKQAKQQETVQQQEEASVEAEQPQPKSKKKGKKNDTATESQATDEIVDKMAVDVDDQSVKARNITDSEIAGSEEDAYALDDDAYSTDKDTKQ